MSDRRDPDGGTGLQTKTKKRVQQPKKYRVVLHNDHYTTMEFVVDVLKKVFHKSAAEAHAIMMSVHQKGRGMVGIYPYDIAATKIEKTRSMARRNGYPLKCTMEEAD